MTNRLKFLDFSLTHVLCICLSFHNACIVGFRKV